MRWNLRALLPKGGIIIFFFLLCGDQRAQVPGKGETLSRDQAGQSAAAGPGTVVSDNPYPTIGSIPVPAGYQRVRADKGSFGAWLRQIPLKKDRTVYLFDGSPKRNQEAQFAVLAVSVGSKDLQQCADAVMRLRAEYLYAQKDFAAIEFTTGQGLRLNFREWAGGRRVRLSGGRLVQYGQTGTFCADRACFSAYLETVFSYCGTLSLEKQLVPVRPFSRMHIGDVLIRGGAPGHAMLVVDMAVDLQGRTLYMLAQSYMPAQDIHIVNSPLEESPGHGAQGPWYPIDQREDDRREGDRGKADPGKENHGPEVIQTPEYTFYTSQLRTWPARSGRTQ